MSSPHRTLRHALMVSTATLIALEAHAAAPAAGTVIGNRAAATYVNASGDTVSVTSNEVETIVQQVAGLTLATDASETAAPGGKVFLPHSVTNAGNGVDTFNLSAVEAVVGGAFDFTGITIYPDANFDGVADSTTPITVTPALAAGDAFGIVIEATVPAGATATSAQDITVTATSQFSGAVTATNTDTITVSNGAITEVVKSMVVTDGAGAAADGINGPGDTVTIQLTYSSTGLVDASNLVITDVLDANLVYSAGTARWSDSATVLTDADDAFELSNGGGQQIDFQYDGSDTVTITLDSVPSGRSGTVTFTAVIGNAAVAGEITNIATQTVGGVAQPPSNRATISVQESFAVTVADAASTSHETGTDGAGNLAATPGSSTDDDGALNDIVTESGDVHQGGAVRFEFVVTNQSNAASTIDLSAANTSFPAGTTFQILSADNATPIVGPLGPLASGASATVNLVATLPSNAGAAAAGATNYSATLNAQSTDGGAVNTSTALFTGAVLAATVDLENTDGTGNGANPTNGGDPWIDVATDPGDPASYTVVVQNQGPTAETYALSLDTPLPAGWTAEFFLPNGQPVTNTGVIPAGGSQNITVVITPPATATPVDQPITLRVTSPTSGQADTLTNAVVVNTIVDMAVTPDQTVQLSPGGVADVPHTLRNLGNITITEGAVALGGGFSSFSGTIFHDVNGDGLVDAGDVVIDNINDIAGGIAPGATVPLILRVQAPSTGAVGVSETETLSVASTLNSGAATENVATTGNNAATATAIIVSNDLTLSKAQALDAGCNGTLGTFTAARIQAAPGQCVRYRITATNTGTQDASTVTIRDTIPGYTTLTECGGACAVDLSPAGSSATTMPAEGGTGAMETAHGTLRPGAPAVLSFTVRIDQ